jgi:hypothetical protein
MKKLVLLLSLLAFVVAAPMAMAAAKKEKPMKINCCVKGKFKKNVTKEACEKKGGKEVMSKDECKPEPKPAKPSKMK